MDTTQLHTTVRISEQAIAKILDRLDTSQQYVKAENRRYERYFPYRSHATIVYIMHPGSTSFIGYLSPTRNISQSGIAFLHSSFVHFNSKCEIHLQRLDGTWQQLSGRVVRCVHIEGALHEIGVKLANEINPLDFFEKS